MKLKSFLSKLSDGHAQAAVGSASTGQVHLDEETTPAGTSTPSELSQTRAGGGESLEAQVAALQREVARLHKVR